MSEKLCVIMPVYNEQAIVGVVLSKWVRALDELDIDYVIRPCDDGSKDATLSVLQTQAARLSRIDVRHHTNAGHGPTLVRGYREAADDGFDWIFQVDSDDEMGTESFPELWAKRGGYDFLVGRRAGRRSAWPRRIISFVSRLCVRFCYGKSVWDVNSPYRLMRVSAFADAFRRIPSSTFAPNVILSGIAARLKFRCLEIPVPQHERKTGEVSIRKFKLLRAAVRSFMQTVAFAIR